MTTGFLLFTKVPIVSIEGFLVYKGLTVYSRDNRVLTVSKVPIVSIEELTVYKGLTVYSHDNRVLTVY